MQPAHDDFESLSASATSWDSLGRLGRLVRKELFEILRDRRTILTLVAMPLLLYPLLSIAFQQFFLASALDPRHKIEYSIGFETEREAHVFTSHVSLVPFNPEKAKLGVPPAHVKVLLVEEDQYRNLEAALQAGAIQLGIRLPQVKELKFPLHKDVALKCEMVYQRSAPGSLAALEFVERRIAAAHVRMLAQRLNVADIEPHALLLKVRRVSVEEAGAASLISLSALVPLILILMTITGAVYPAIDLTAGERERGTLEILVAAPVPRLGLLFAKYVTVVTVAVLTAVVNLVSMMVTLAFSQLGAILIGDRGLSPLLILELFALLILFAMFFSAVLLSLTSFARSFKEAQAYLIPLMLASLAPGLVGMLPGLKLEGILTVLPLVNIVLLARDLFDGVADPGAAFVVVLATAIYALAAISLAARIFGTESVLYNEQGSWADLVRRPHETSAIPTVASALGCLALIIPAHFILQSFGLHLSMAMTLVYMVFLSVLFHVGFPLLAGWWSRVQLASALNLRAAQPLAYVAGLLLGVALVPVVLQVLALVSSDIPAWQQREIEQNLQGWRQTRQAMLVGLILVFVIIAVSEEVLFRGYLFSALRARTSALATIGVSALLFGLMHMLSPSLLGWERLFATTLLGIVLGWVCWRTNSIWPGMLLHACYNGVLVLVGAEETGKTNALPWPWLVGGAIGTMLGFALLALAGTKKT